MAVYIFAQSILEGKEVPLYEDRYVLSCTLIVLTSLHCSSDAVGLGRDFTYIDDIVQGIIASLDYTPSECGERFNLGFGNPVSVPSMLDILQKELGVEGKIVSMEKYFAFQALHMCISFRKKLLCRRRRFYELGRICQPLPRS
jgi:nucleoside-diphosphate-sugar epimerase